MHVRNALFSALIAGAVAAALPASAKTYKFTLTGRETPINMPDDWAATPIKSGIQLKSGDSEVYIWIQAMDDRNVQPLIDEYFSYYSQQGVAFSGGTKKTNDEIAGVPIVMMDTPATYQGSPTIIRFIISEPKPGASKGLLLGYWASPQGDKTHSEPVTQIIVDLLRP